MFGHWHVILHLSAKFRINRSIGGRVMTSYPCIIILNGNVRWKTHKNITMQYSLAVAIFVSS